MIDVRVPQWSRLEGQSCKVPNQVYKSLPFSEIASLNLTVSGNVHCIKFSPCGLKLAAGLDTEELHTVLIFEVISIAKFQLFQILIKHLHEVRRHIAHRTHDFIMYEIFSFNCTDSLR